MQKSPKNNLVVFDIANIQRKVINFIQKKQFIAVEELERHLMIWWCRYYRKPYKCAEILEYNFEELLFEFYDIYYREHPDEVKKFLNVNVKIQGEDEQWLKDAMGDDYISSEEQENILQETKKELAKVDLPEEFSITFDE
jgi:hypothetical protein